MKHWLPPIFLLIYFLFYFINVDGIELDFWSAEELMNARTLPNILGALGLGVVLLQLAILSIGERSPLPGTTERQPTAVIRWLKALPVSFTKASRLKGTSRINLLEQSKAQVPILVLSAVFLVYISLIDGLGFTIASMGFLLIAPWLLGHRQLLTCLGIGIGVPLCFEGVFLLLGIYLPPGQWFG